MQSPLFNQKEVTVKPERDGYQRPYDTIQKTKSDPMYRTLPLFPYSLFYHNLCKLQRFLWILNDMYA